MNHEDVARLAAKINANISTVIFGKSEKITFILTALFCGGHVLLDDIPGTGKTSLAKALARSISADSKRIQFTPDLLPSDITGINYFNQKTGDFEFRRGPVFSNIIIADEINRTTPRTQSALLECMEEFQTTVDGVTYPFELPFFVIATQNPIETLGTFPLPEAQTDRFFIKLSIGYPDRASETTMLDTYIPGNPQEELEAVCGRADIVSAAEAVRRIFASPRIKEYVVSICSATRESERLRLGVSPRGTLALLRASQAYAAISGRDFVLPDDVKAVAVPVLSHRIISEAQSVVRLSETGENIINYIVEKTPVPIE